MSSWLFAGVIAIVLKVVLVDLKSWDLTPQLLYYGPYSLRDGGMRLLDFGVLIAFLVLCSRLLSRGASKSIAPLMSITAMGLLFIYTSLELNSLLHTYVPGLRAGGISILWSMFAFAWLLRGIWRNQRGLRYAGLLLFGITIFKVFFNDLAELDQFYRIVAFIVLGGVVLAGSFIYLKYRETFAVDEESAASKEQPS